MAKKKTNKVVAIIVYGALALLLLAVIAFIFKFTYGFTDDFKTFYVEYEGSMIINDKEMKLPADAPLQFDVKYTFDNLDKNAAPKGYKLAVVPNVTDETDFEFTVDGRVNTFKDLKEAGTDFYKYFDVDKQDSNFTITLHSDMTMQSILQKVYEDKTVAVPGTIDLYKQCYFALVVTSYNGKSQVTIPFSLTGWTLVVKPNNIIF